MIASYQGKTENIYTYYILSVNLILKSIHEADWIWTAQMF